ncbi:MAG: nucleotidyl transferase AbiEii/AbiGii toxin family protein [Candidatus Falkowbacteria bacterium]
MLNWKKHKIILVQILKDIYDDIEISSYLGFKGGTACYLFYNLPRYSVDLDFDLLSIDKKEDIYKKIKNVIVKFGKIKDERIKRNTIFFLLSYGEEEHNIKIEISTRELEADYEILSYFGISMKVMAKKDIFAYKLVALTQRKKIAARDLFDLHYFFSNNWDINENIIFEQTKKKLNSYLKEVLKFIDKIPDNSVLQGLGQLIDAKQKDWIRRNLKKELILLINSYRD